MNCHHCGKPAMWEIGPPGRKILLCLECNLKNQQAAALVSDGYERALNYLHEQMEYTVGLSTTPPRFPPRQLPPIVQGGNVTLNNITVTDSTIGLLNTGNLEMVDSAITVLKSNPQTKDVADAISKLATAIANADLPKEKKSEAIEILNTIATEATAPESKRKSSVVRRLMTALPTLIQTSASAIEVWNTAAPILGPLFGVAP